MDDKIRKKKHTMQDEDGFVLVLGLVALVTLSLLGVWAMNSATVEMLISGNHQRFEESFQIADGATSAEGGELGFNRQPWYEVPDPNDKGKAMVPTANGDFDPGDDIEQDNPQTVFENADDTDRKADSSFWPMQNLVRDNADNEYDYAYLVTFLYDAMPPKGTGTDFSAYKFRINSNKTINLEMGGSKLGPKVVGFED